MFARLAHSRGRGVNHDKVRRHGLDGRLGPFLSIHLTTRGEIPRGLLTAEFPLKRVPQLLRAGRKQRTDAVAQAPLLHATVETSDRKTAVLEPPFDLFVIQATGLAQPP